MDTQDASRANDVAVEAAELAARESYGRLLARLVRRTRDIEAAEDALCDAFVAALEQWPREGVPSNPDGWLLHVAKRRLGDQFRHRRVKESAESVVSIAEELERESRAEAVHDDRVPLLFLCAQPEIDEAARAPLMLQIVLGVDAARIAAAFLTSPATMSQRLVRAKARARDAGLTVHAPTEAERRERLPAVLDAIYAAYGTGWDASTGAESSVGGLCREAIWLARLVAHEMADEPEAWGLLALLLHTEARSTARRSASSEYVPLPSQDTSRWDHALIREAESALDAASRVHRGGLPGRYALEAAIQSVHARRHMTGETDWFTIVQLYLGLLQVAPSVGAAVAHAAALAEAYGPRAGLDGLFAIPDASVATYQPYWAVRAHVEGRLRLPSANESLEKAVGLTTDAAVRAFLQASISTTSADHLRNPRHDD